ncbi:undecaprenyl-phosphate glucose phosphotransferase [uncultured Gelidibacter sp.]|uniref:undecaprenyl-phosphate glucose phosphotransferase n=1 Tax=uncultured Gelidibacter sp. TaxID=259318 RepID=UPI00260906BE|nr:undecaprenyl-phosphate glucose phosphotransferase [uncultured Gelidibacter sp.]
MRSFKQGRYSKYLRPISYLIDLSIINILALLHFFPTIDSLTFVLVISSAWIVLSIASRFYQVYRFTREVTILALIIRQMILFTIIIFAFSGVFPKFEIYPKTVINYVLLVFLLIAIFKFAMYYLLQKYRVAFGGNYRKTVILGANKKALALEKFFNENPEYGYIHKKTFSFTNTTEAELRSCFEYIKANAIDEIYCSISELSNIQIIEVTQFADNNLKILKFLPDNKEINSKKLKYEYYDYIPVLSLRTIPLEDSINTIVKRTFDIVLSIFIIVFILSWLAPIIAILIKLDSKGPVFFKQPRNGFNYRVFDCYKFRSMILNSEAHISQATRGDERVTKFGSFLRKTSLDELPQFVNVLFGDMSVVGPRPHMVSHTNIYANRIDKFMVRHFVKPGITGLAQISGFRGEVETDKDIIGRVKYDIYYIENWSLLLDLKIIFRTVYNAIKGDEKAY